MIHVHLHSNGAYWQARWTDPMGRRKARSIGGKAKTTEREARARCQEIAAELHAGHTGDRSPTLGRWVEDFTRLCDHWSYQTRRAYEHDLTLMVRFFGPDRRLDSIRRRDAEDLRLWLAGRGLSDETVRKTLRHCSACLGQRRGAVGMELMTRNPFASMSKSPRPRQEKLPYYSPAQFLDVFDRCPDSRWACLIALARFAGLRQGEAQRLTWADVDFDRLSLTVRPQSGHKTTKSALRTVPVTPHAAPILNGRYLDASPGETLVVGLPTATLTAQVRSILEGAGLVGIPKPLHTLRAMCRVDWASEYPELDVTQWIGHTSGVGLHHYHQTHSHTWQRVTGAK